MEALNQAYQTLYLILLIVLGVCMFFALARAIIGRRIVDRIMGINMIGTMVIAAITVLAMKMAEKYLLDVCLIYVLISFLATLTLCKLYISVDRMRKKEREEHHDA